MCTGLILSRLEVPKLLIYKPMHNIKTNFDKLFPIVKEMLKDQVNDHGNYVRPGPEAEFTDLEVITLSLTSEALSIDSETYLFAKLNSEYLEDFPNLIDRSRYNVRRRALFPAIENLRKRLVLRVVESEDTFIVDSMPLEICKISRASRAKICKENLENFPDKGYCPSQKTYYYGYKFHGVCSVNGVFFSFDLSPASVHDIHYMKDIKNQFSNCLLLADKGYIGAEQQLSLFQTQRIQLEVPMRRNQHGYRPQAYIFRKSRKRIETLFSQLNDQFLINRNYAKSFSGFKTRVLAKLTALTIIQYLNKVILDRPINHIKHALA